MSRTYRTTGLDQLGPVHATALGELAWLRSHKRIIKKSLRSRIALSAAHRAPVTVSLPKLSFLALRASNKES